MPTICSPLPIPDFNSLYAAIKPLLTWPPTLFSVPALPGIPDPIFPGFKIPNIELLLIAEQLQTYQLLTTMSAFITPMVTFLGLQLAAVLPKIPIVGLTLVDLLLLEPGAIYSAVAGAYASISAAIPGIPTKIFNAVTIPAIQIALAVQDILQGYLSSLITTLSGLISQVVNKLGLSALLNLPIIPALSDLEALVISPLLGAAEISALLAGTSLNALLALISVPGFPNLPALPDPLIPSFNFPEMNFQIGLSVLYANIVAYPMTLILNFINQFLTVLGFTFPLICITL